MPIPILTPEQIEGKSRRETRELIKFNEGHMRELDRQMEQICKTRRSSVTRDAECIVLEFRKNQIWKENALLERHLKSLEM